MTTTNSITGDKIQTKNVSEQYRSNYDLIFRKEPKNVLKSEQPSSKKEQQHETQKSID